MVTSVCAPNININTPTRVLLGPISNVGCMHLLALHRSLVTTSNDRNEMAVNFIVKIALRL
jgi:hypothetical protein